MIQITAQMRVLVAIEAVDGRKGIDSLARLCQEKLAEDPFSGCVFVFRSRSGTAIRLLSYDGQGYWLAQKRLSKAAAVEFKYRGRKISQEDVLYIRALIDSHPNESRRTLSTKLCEARQWRQANGALRDMVCRGMLLVLDRAGQITLPAVSYVRHNPLAKRARPEPAVIDTTPMEDRLQHLQPLEFEQVRRTSKEPLFNSLMEEYHYLGYEQPVGEHLKYL